MREFINIIQLNETADLKKTIVDLVKTTDEEPVLHRVLKVLKSGNIEERVAAVLSKDADASKFTQKIAEFINNIDAPIEEKDDFLKRYPKGLVDTGGLLSGNPKTFSDFLGHNEFAVELFKLMSVNLVSQGVGPGEVALAVLSPNISWSGRVKGGGDVQIDGKAVEVKTSVSSGGRWVNARKANMDMAGIKKAIADAEQSAMIKLTGNKDNPPRDMPDRLSISTWVNEIRPNIGQDVGLLKQVTKVMADGLFTHTNNSAYQQALADGGEQDILMALMNVGYDNYKACSDFEGILLMDMKVETAQYFTEFAQMKGRIKIDSAYLYAPESEAMPKVKILAAGQLGGGDEADDDYEEPAAPVAKPKVMTGGNVDAGDLSFGPGAGRERKKADLGRQRR
jgi:hypothetical protein